MVIMDNREAPIVSENERDRLREITDRMKADNDKYFEETGRRKLVFTQTFGCQMRVSNHDLV